MASGFAGKPLKPTRRAAAGIFTALLVCACLMPAHAEPMERFGFRWDTAWTWQQLAAHVSRVAPEATPQVRHLQQAVTMEQARLLLRWLAAVPYVARVRLLPEQAEHDLSTTRVAVARREIQAAIADVTPPDSLSGMLLVAERLASARALLKDRFLPDPGSRPSPSLRPASKGSPRIRVRFDFTPAEALLDCLSADRVDDNRWEQIAAMPVFQRLLARTAADRVNRDELLRLWKRAQDPDPLNRLYEWVFPGSYYDYGGIAVQAGVYRSLISRLRAAETGIVATVSSRLGACLPNDLSVDAIATYLFAANTDAWTSGDVIGIDLEHFGDNYDYLTRAITHECFHRAQAAAVLPVTTLARDPDDRALNDELLMAVWREGCASYAGAAWSQPPTDRELAQDFKDFEAACDQLYAHGRKVDYEERIHEGLLNAGTYYRMGWRMSQVIANRSGHKTFADVQTLGPAAFFAAYIRAYRAASRTEAPDAQRFRPDRERVLLRIARGMEAPPLLEAAAVARLPDRTRMRDEARRFAVRYAGKPVAALALVLLGENLARRGETHLAREVMEPGIRMLGLDAPWLARRESDLLINADAASEAIALLRAAVETAPGDPDPLYRLGEAYRLSGNLAAARDAYSRALAVSPGYEPARRALEGMRDRP